MSEIKLLAMDLDGTLLKDDKTISTRSKDALRAAIAAGIEVVPVTGRPSSGLPSDLSDIEGINYLITSNGALTEDLRTGSIIRSAFIEKEAVLRIAKLALDGGEILNVFIDGYGYSLKESYDRLIDEFRGKVLEDYVRKSRKVTDDIISVIKERGERTENVWIRVKDRQTETEMRSFISERFPVRIIVNAPKELEIGSMGSDKGLALAHLAEHLGLSRGQVAAFGDNENDLGMLNTAGLSVAMGNARDCARAAADVVADTNENDGVARIIEEILKNPVPTLI